MTLLWYCSTSWQLGSLATWSLFGGCRGLLLEQSGFWYILCLLFHYLSPSPLTPSSILEKVCHAHTLLSLSILQTVQVGCGCWDFLLAYRLVVLIFCLHFSYLLVHLTKLLATVWTRLPLTLICFLYFPEYPCTNIISSLLPPISLLPLLSIPRIITITSVIIVEVGFQ